MFRWRCFDFHLLFIYIVVFFYLFFPCRADRQTDYKRRLPPANNNSQTDRHTHKIEKKHGRNSDVLSTERRGLLALGLCPLGPHFRRGTIKCRYCTKQSRQIKEQMGSRVVGNKTTTVLLVMDVLNVWFRLAFLLNLIRNRSPFRLFTCFSSPENYPHIQKLYLGR